MNLNDVFLLIHPDKRIFQMSGLEYRLLMLDAPALKLPVFADQRVRFAHLCVYLRGAHSGSITRSFYRYLAFKSDGEVDRDAFFNPLFNEFERALEAKRNPPVRVGNIVEAQTRFEKNATTWAPDAEQLAQIQAVAFKRTASLPLAQLYVPAVAESA